MEAEMKLTEGLKTKLFNFEKNKELSLSPDEARELQKFCQVKFHFRVDLSCNDCVARHALRVVKYLKEND